MQEWFDAGAIGQVREVHCWTNRPIWPQGMPRPTDTQAVPDGLDWDLWLGPAPMRPFQKTYHPFGWRAWQDFGAGAMGDMACHVMDAADTVLKLGAPTSVQATIAYNFLPRPRTERVRPTRAIQRQLSAVVDDPPVLPGARQHATGEAALSRRRPAAERGRRSRAGSELPESGTIFVGDKGKMWCETYSESPRLIPETFMQAFQRPPQTLPRVPDGRSGHEKNWLDAIREGPGGVGLRLHEAVHRVHAARQRGPALPGVQLMWDAPNAEDHQHAGRRPVRQSHNRAGWSLST